jgi:4-aminobutyrate aminotransferase-like enzyme
VRASPATGIGALVVAVGEALGSDVPRQPWRCILLPGFAPASNDLAPVRSLIGKTAVMDGAAPGGLGGTYAGNPVALAASHAVTEVMHEEGLLECSVALGARLVAHLDALRKRVPQLAEVRGLGSMVAAEFCAGGSAMRRPDDAFAKRVQQVAFDSGLILLACGGGNGARFLYPLTIEDGVFAEALAIIERAILAAGQ